MSTPPAPKRDKFAALAAAQKQQQHQQQQQQKVAEVPTSNRGDKFASLQHQASKQHEQTQAEQEQVQPQDQQQLDQPTTLSTAAGVTGASQQQRPRDKFASLSAIQQQQQQNQDATDIADAVADNNATTEGMTAAGDSEMTTTTTTNASFPHRNRDAVWEDLERAQAAVARLMDLAAQTTDALAAAVWASTSSTPLDPLVETTTSTTMRVAPSILADRFQSTLQEIHALLKPHARHVQPYTKNTLQQSLGVKNRVYLERAEHQMAVSRLKLLQQLCQQQHQDQHKNDETTLDDFENGMHNSQETMNPGNETVSAADPDIVIDNGPTILTIDGKRKRDHSMNE